jgi:hypothetical protein
MQSIWHSRLTPVLAVAGVLALAAGVLHYIAKPKATSPKTEPSLARAVAPAIVQSHPIDPALRSIHQLFALAKSEANKWQPDAKMIRFYVADTQLDGSVDPLTVSVQSVFVSPALVAQAQSLNALRWQLQDGKSSSQPISKYPAPQLGFPDAALCDIAKVGGVDAPPRVGVDLSFVSDGDREPLLSVFTKSPKWLAVADPFRCEVKGRTDKELKGSPEIDDTHAQDNKGVPFDRDKAHEQLRKALADLSRCSSSDGPKGPGLLAVMFDQSGKVQSVEFRSDGFSGTSAGACIEQLVRKVEIPPWNSGRGYVATKFVLN